MACEFGGLWWSVGGLPLPQSKCPTYRERGLPWGTYEDFSGQILAPGFLPFLLSLSEVGVGSFLRRTIPGSCLTPQSLTQTCHFYWSILCPFSHYISHSRKMNPFSFQDQSVDEESEFISKVLPLLSKKKEQHCHGSEGDCPYGGSPIIRWGNHQQNDHTHCQSKISTPPK